MLDDIAPIIRDGPARIGFTLGVEFEEALTNPRWVAWWLPVRPVSRLLIASELRGPLVFSDTGEGGGWQRVPVETLSRAGFAPSTLNRALGGAVLEAWMAGDPAALYPCDLLRYAGVDVRMRPLSERLALMRQLLAGIRVPGRWFRSHALTGGPQLTDVSAPAGMRPLLRRLERPYPRSDQRLEWLMPLR